MYFLRLLRLPNLLIVALTQSLLYWQLILPTYQTQQIEPALNALHFSILSLITLIITASGYIINDIVDMQIDLINKPAKIIVGKYISKSKAWKIYAYTGLLGFVLSFYLAHQVNRMPLLFIYPLAVAGLLLYSYIFKKTALIGNVIVSVYCAGAAGIIWIAEYQSIQQLTDIMKVKVTSMIFWYMVFAFLSTLFREVVKDLEDVKGDAAQYATTAPIRWGIKTAKNIAICTAVLLMGLLGYWAFFSALEVRTWGILFFILISFLILTSLIKLLKASEKSHFHRISQLAKVIMLLGLTLLPFLK